MPTQGLALSWDRVCLCRTQSTFFGVPFLLVGFPEEPSHKQHQSHDEDTQEFR